MGDHLDQSAIDALINNQKKEPESPAEQNPETEAQLGQNEIDALFSNQAVKGEEAEPSEDSGHSNSFLTQEEVDAMVVEPKGPVFEKEQLANMAKSVEGKDYSESSIVQGEVDNLLGKKEKAPPASTSMDQSEIDALLAGQSSTPVNEAIQPDLSSESLGQDEIDALFGGGASAKVSDTVPGESLKAESASTSSGQMDQSEIDALFGGGSVETSAPSASMDQAEIDALLQGGNTFAESAAPEAQSAVLDQAEIQYLLKKENVPSVVPPVEKEVPQLPNQLDAPTVASHACHKIIRAGGQNQRARLFGGNFYLPDRIEKRELVLQALQKLFERAKAYKEKTVEGNVCQITCRRGYHVSVHLTDDSSKPVALRFEAVHFVDRLRKNRKIQQTILVDYFAKNSGTTASRWVNWFDKQFDSDSLQHLLLCA